MLGRKLFGKYAKIFGFIDFLVSLLPFAFKNYLFKFFRNTNGYFGLVIRYVLIKSLAKKCGDNVSIHPGCYIYNINNIILGDNVSVHPLCYIDGAGGLNIGANVSIAHNSSILTTSHTWSDVSIPIKYNKVINSPCIIENDVWVGCGVRILAGVHIEGRSVIAAGSVVNKNVLKNTVVAGVPAKFIKNTM